MVQVNSAVGGDVLKYLELIWVREGKECENKVSVKDKNMEKSYILEGWVLFLLFILPS